MTGVPAKKDENKQTVEELLHIIQDGRNQKLIQMRKDARNRYKTHFDSLLNYRENIVMVEIESKLQAAGSFSPFLLLNVAYMTTDAALYFNTMHAMILLLSPSIKFGFPQRESLEEFVMALGVSKELLHDMTYFNSELSISSGEYLLQNLEYQNWMNDPGEVKQPESLDTCYEYQLFSKLSMEKAATALINVGTAFTTGDDKSIPAYLVARLFVVFDNISIRYMKRPLLRYIYDALAAIVSLKNPELQKAHEKMSAYQEQKLHSVGITEEWLKDFDLLDNQYDQNVAAFIDIDSALSSNAIHKKLFANVNRTEIALRMYSICVVQLLTLGMVPELLTIMGSIVKCITILTHPKFADKKDLKVASALLHLLYALGIDDSILKLQHDSSVLKIKRNTPEFKQVKNNIASKLKENFHSHDALLTNVLNKTKVKKLGEALQKISNGLKNLITKPEYTLQIKADENLEKVWKKIGIEKGTTEANAVAILRNTEIIIWEKGDDSKRQAFRIDKNVHDKYIKTLNKIQPKHSKKPKDSKKIEPKGYLDSLKKLLPRSLFDSKQSKVL